MASQTWGTFFWDTLYLIFKIFEECCTIRGLRDNVPTLPGPSADIENKLVITGKIKLSKRQLSCARPWPCIVWDRPVTIRLSCEAKFSQIISPGVTFPSKMSRVFAVVLIFLVSSSNLERNYYEISDLRGTYQDTQEDHADFLELEEFEPTRERRSSFYRCFWLI